MKEGEIQRKGQGKKDGLWGKKELDRKRGRNERRETVKWRQNKWERRKRGGSVGVM